MADREYPPADGRFPTLLEQIDHALDELHQLSLSDAIAWDSEELRRINTLYCFLLEDVRPSVERLTRVETFAFRSHLALSRSEDLPPRYGGDRPFMAPPLPGYGGSEL